MSALPRIPIHPVLAAAYPVVALMASNALQVNPAVGIRSLIASLAFTALIFLLLFLLMRDWHRAALIASLAMFMFFTYGHAYNGLDTLQLAGIRLGRHRYLLPIWALIFAAGTWLAVSPRRDPERATTPLNLIGLSLLAISSLQLASIEVDRSGILDSGSLEDQNENLPTQMLAKSESPPDIYFIVLDAYARDDVLSERYGIDNSAFYSDLSELGFTVVSCSVSNYAQTELSFAATLNLSYLDELDIYGDTDGRDRSRLWPLIRRSELRQFLEAAGYSVIAFETGYRWSELEDADIYYEAPTDAPLGLNAFEATLIRSTVYWALADVTNQVPGFLLKDFDRSAEEHFQRIEFVLETLPELSKMAGPKFVFAHLVSPHSPFVFGQNGEFLDYSKFDDALSEEAFAAGYHNQIRFLNDRFVTILTALTDSEGGPPAIILQSDHGPERGSIADRMKPLNAILLPTTVPIRQDLSLVNTFRLVLNALFDAGLAELPDASYYSTYDAPFDFQHVTDECSA